MAGSQPCGTAEFHRGISGLGLTPHSVTIVAEHSPAPLTAIITVTECRLRTPPRVRCERRGREAPSGHGCGTRTCEFHVLKRFLLPYEPYRSRESTEHTNSGEARALASAPSAGTPGAGDARCSGRPPRRRWRPVAAAARPGPRGGRGHGAPRVCPGHTVLLPRADFPRCGLSCGLSLYKGKVKKHMK